MAGTESTRSLGLWGKMKSLLGKPQPSKTQGPDQKWVCVVPIQALNGKPGAVWLPLRSISRTPLPNMRHLWTAIAEHEGASYKMFCISDEPVLAQPADYTWQVQQPPVPIAETPKVVVGARA